MEDNKESKGNLTLFRIGDDIDNRGGLIIKNIENYNVGKEGDIVKKPTDEAPIKEPIVDIPAETLLPEPEPQNKIDQLMDKLNAPVITPIDRFKAGITYLVESNIADNDYEYVAVLKYIQELEVFDKFGYNDFISLLMDSGKFTHETCPKSSNLSKIIITGTYPNWKVQEKKYDVVRQLLNVVNTFIIGCKRIQQN